MMFLEPVLTPSAGPPPHHRANAPLVVLCNALNMFEPIGREAGTQVLLNSGFNAGVF